jgi:hypothetical protein
MDEAQLGLEGRETDYNLINIRSRLPMELKTARLTVLIDPSKKKAFEDLCRMQDMTPSQVIRRLIRDYMETQAPAAAAARKSATRKTAAPGKAVARKAN